MPRGPLADENRQLSKDARSVFGSNVYFDHVLHRGSWYGLLSIIEDERLGIKIVMFFYAPRYFGLWQTIFWAWVLAKLISHRAAERKAQAVSMDQIRRYYPRAW